MANLETKRLRMIPFTLELVEATIKGREELKKMVPYKISLEWPMPDYKDILPWIAEGLRKNPEQSKWSGLIVHMEDNVIIGDIGCKGAPDSNGTVEIGYSIVSRYQGNGYATEIAKAFVEWLQQNEEVQTIKADCLISNVASSRVLEKAGFTCVLEEHHMKYWIVR
ncbi:GNAT family N-acetyltransferase [Bacillus sp. DX4.1]|uniref:GNAT family N-acetyltransferase n=1 Tax=Bacillus sp. DX4.1 TaxID=3055867 RepID=UPI0025A0C077|nr:GNAT family N-acetyltransferase [Bacillus sp. DX4.1]MDM5186455.1 GNAT family N-acetyltransferase [Bacillus sp. DX4.1]